MTTTVPATMPAAVYKGPRVLEVEAVPVPELGPRDVLVEVAYCGVCGSDLHMVLDGWGRPGSWGGHEYSGEVVAVGEEVRRWSSGDRVVGRPRPGCGTCELCRAGRPSLCAERATPGTLPFHGAFARYVRLDETELTAVPEGLGLREAALTEPLAVALHALTRSGVRAGQRAFVSGAGPIGALAVAALAARGVEEVTVSEPSPLRRRLAREVGATAVVEPDELAVPSAAEPMVLVPGAAHVALECSGKAAAMEAALAQLDKGGTLVLVGAGMERPCFDNNRILLNELVVTGAFEYDATGFDDALDLLASGALPTETLLEPGAVPLNGLLPAMEALAAGDIAGKVLVQPDRGG